MNLKKALAQRNEPGALETTLVVKSLGGISVKITGVAKKQMAAPVFTGTATAVRKASVGLFRNHLIFLAEGVGLEQIPQAFVFIRIIIRTIFLVPLLIPPIIRSHEQ